jgi:lysophospholipase L1-like esterase
VESTWSTRGQSPESRPAFGLSSFRLTANQPGAGLSLTAAPQNAFTRLTVCAETAPGAGGYVVTLGQLTTHVSLSDPSVRVACANFEAQQPQTVATLTTEGGPVTLTSWASFSDKPGVVVSNLGVVGTQLRHFAETSDAAVGEELRAYRPDLIVLAFGTNEGFSGHFDAYAYEAGLRNQITRLRRLSGNVPILLLGPPDAETRRRDLLHNDDSGAPAASEAARPLNIDDLLDAAPTPDSEPPPSSRSDLPWYPPPALAQIRAIQRRVAASMGTAFWDWCAAEGGPGSADRMANSVPPLRRGDHVHYTTAGGAVIARMLQSDLDAAAASPRAD